MPNYLPHLWFFFGPVNNKWFHSNLYVWKPPHWNNSSFHLPFKLLTIVFIEKLHLNGQPRKGKNTIIEIMKSTMKEDFRLGMVFSCFLYHRITLFENKYRIKLITLISMYHLNLLSSCEPADSFKIKMQMYKLLLVLTLFRSFS